MGSDSRRALRLPRWAAPVAVLLTSAIALSVAVDRLVSNGAAPASSAGVFYVVDPADATRLLVYDWTGRARGTVQLGSTLTASNWLWAAPDGSSLIRTAPDASAQWLDPHGNPVPGGQMSRFVYRTYLWSADSRGICRLAVIEGRAFQLTTVTTAGIPHVVTTFAVGPDLDPAIDLAACSFANDRAILLRSYSEVGRRPDLLAVQLSTGEVTVVESGQPVGYEVSPTASFVAENRYSSGADSVTAIHALGESSDAVTRPIGVTMFSGDGSMVMAGAGQTLEMLDWRSGRSLWRYTGGPLSVFGYFPEPGGKRFVVATLVRGAGCPCSPFPPMTVTIVNADGSTVRIPGNPVLVVPELPT